MTIMQIAQTETLPIDENIFVGLSGLPKMQTPDELMPGFQGRYKYYLRDGAGTIRQVVTEARCMQGLEK